MAFVDEDDDDDDDDDVDHDDDEDDSKPADVAKSFNFCDRPTLCGFIANEWCAITVCGSPDKFVTVANDGEIYLQKKKKKQKINQEIFV